MKKAKIVYYAALILLLASACKPETDIKNEEEAIKTVINAETQAWIDRNPEKMKEYYIQDEYQTRLNIQDSIYSLTTGWDKRSHAIDTLAKYADWVGVDAFRSEKEFLVIKVKDNTAWAILKETQNMVFNGSPARAIAIINISLEKQKGEWKIACFVKSNI